MLLDVCLGTKSAWRILFVLAEAPGKAVNRKEIQELTGLGNKVLTKFLLVLERFNLVLSDKIGRTYTYKLNMANPLTEKILEVIRLEKRELNNPDFAALTLLREFVYELTNIHLENIQHVILFGSFAKRTQHAGSDIDVAIIVGEKDANDEILLADIIGRLKERFGKEIQPHLYTKREFAESRKTSTLVQEILKDGITLM